MRKNIRDLTVKLLLMIMHVCAKQLKNKLKIRHIFLPSLSGQA